MLFSASICSIFLPSCVYLRLPHTSSTAVTSLQSIHHRRIIINLWVPVIHIFCTGHSRFSPTSSSAISWLQSVQNGVIIDLCICITITIFWQWILLPLQFLKECSWRRKHRHISWKHSLNISRLCWRDLWRGGLRTNWRWHENNRKYAVCTHPGLMVCMDHCQE